MGADPSASCGCVVGMPGLIPGVVLSICRYGCLLRVINRSYSDRAPPSRISWIRLLFVTHALSLEELVKSITGHR